jgi:hypothetical protein
MGTQHGFSRRHMLAISAAAGSLAIGGDYRDAAAQGGKRVEQYAPELDGIISTSNPSRNLLRAQAARSGRLKGRSGGRKAAIFSTATSTTTGV